MCNAPMLSNNQKNMERSHITNYTQVITHQGTTEEAFEIKHYLRLQCNNPKLYLEKS